jgi:hypothetical protein
LPKYSGKKLSEYRQFERRANILFALDPESFRPDKHRIIFAMSSLTGEAAAMADRDNFLQEATDGSLTWVEFLENLKTLVTKSGVRITTTALKLKNARQYSGQPVAQFAAYLDNLESEFDWITEAQRRDNLLTGIRPELGNAAIMNRVMNQTKTRKELLYRLRAIEPTLGLAYRIMQPRAPGNRSNHRRRAGGIPKKPKSTFRGGNKAPENIVRDVSPSPKNEETDLEMTW